MALPPPPPPATQAGVASEVDAELQQSIAPLEQQASGFAAAEQRGVQDLNNLFSTISPFVAGSAQRVAEQYGATSQAQAGIFEQAWNRLNDLRGERAAQAQALAQQIGAPIPLDSLFTQAIDTERGAFLPEAAGQLLYAQNVGLAGSQQAEAFAGRVFPLQQVRLTQGVHQHFRDLIGDLKKQIASLKATRPGLINERLRQRQLEDYELRLSRAQAQFEQLSTKRSLALEEKRLQAQIAEWKRETATQRRGQNIDKALTEKQLAANKKNNNRTYVTSKKQDLITLSNALASGGSQDVTRHKVVQEVDPVTGAVTLKPVTITETLTTKPVRNPTALLNQLLAQTGIKKGQKELYNFAVAQIVRVLTANGVRGIPADPAKWGAWWKQRQQKQQKAAKQHPNPFPSGRH